MKLKSPSVTNLVNSWNTIKSFECIYFSLLENLTDHDFLIGGTNYILNVRQANGEKLFLIGENLVSDFVFINFKFQVKMTLYAPAN